MFSALPMSVHILEVAVTKQAQILCNLATCCKNCLFSSDLMEPFRDSGGACPGDTCLFGENACALVCFHFHDGFCDIATDLLMPTEAAASVFQVNRLSAGFHWNASAPWAFYRKPFPAVPVGVHSNHGVAWRSAVGDPSPTSMNFGDLKETVEPHFHTSVISATDSLSPLCV